MYDRTKHLGRYAQKGVTPWNKGKKGVQSFTEESRMRMSLVKQGSNHWNWQGGIGKQKQGYRALHSWINRILGKPDTCSKCGLSGLGDRKIHWANKSGKYKREVSDWIRLCSKCHGKYDKENDLRKRMIKINLTK